MEIIKHGKQYIERTCYKCGCVFSFATTEIVKENRYIYDDGIKIDITRYVRCPECGSYIFLDKGE